MIKIVRAQPSMARDIARLIMIAMNYDCCRYFAGENHTLQDFEDAMTRLVAMDESQYSYTNTLAAVADDDSSKPLGVIVSYDGARLHELRKAFVKEALESFGQDFKDIPDETSAGELYLDSLCVDESVRNQGIATMLLRAAIDKARQMGIPEVGLLVDKGNPAAEKLYLRVGFRYKDDNEWGGHPMKHLVYSVG